MGRDERKNSPSTPVAGRDVAGRKAAAAKGTQRPKATLDAEKEARKARRAAREYVEDREKTEHLLAAAMAKATRDKGSLMRVWDDLMALFRLVRAWATGAYRGVPWRTIAFAIGGIIYFVNPFDVVPDFIPLAGYVDDAAVLAVILASIRTDVEDFIEWENSR